MCARYKYIKLNKRYKHATNRIVLKEGEGKEEWGLQGITYSQC